MHQDRAVGAPPEQVQAQRPTPALPKNPPATSSNKKWTYEDFRSNMEGFLREHGSLEVKTKSGAVDVRVRVESLEELERARPVLERVIELGPTNFGWIDREEELKAELLQGLGKVPDALTVNQELRMRDMERKLDRILKALESPKHAGSQ